MKLSSILSMPIHVAKKHVMLTDGKVVLIPATDESTITRLTALNMVEAARTQLEQITKVIEDWEFLQNEDFDNVASGMEISHTALIEDIGPALHESIEL